MTNPDLSALVPKWREEAHAQDVYLESNMTGQLRRAADELEAALTAAPATPLPVKVRDVLTDAKMLLADAQFFTSPEVENASSTIEIIGEILTAAPAAENPGD